MKFWVTKYALTSGIMEVEASDPVGTDYEGMISVRQENSYSHCYHGKDWHRTREAAIEQAEKMCVNKILSLKKSISKLEKLKF